MKIAIQGHPTRGEEVIQILESLGGKNREELTGRRISYYYFINCNGNIDLNLKINLLNRKLYTLEEFKKEFPFKIGDKVTDHEGDVAIITGFVHIEEKLGYSLQYKNGRGTATPGILKLYKKMKEERNITLTLDKAKEWYKKGGELKEIALQAFTEKELNPLPRSWEEFATNHARMGYYISSDGKPLMCASSGKLSSPHVCPSKKSAEAHLAMMQLEQLRNCWWGGWEPEWSNCEKYVIKWDKNDLIVFTARNIHAFLVFPTREMAEEFLKCFRDLIEQAGDLI